LHHLAFRARSRADIDQFHRFLVSRKDHHPRYSRRVSAVWTRVLRRILRRP
jgi:hypothetical protein